MRRTSALLGLFLASSLSAWSQDCAGPMPWTCSLLDRGKTIFVGEVTALAHDSLIYTFRVSERFKGASAAEMHVTRGPWDGPGFSVGRQYLVFADSCPWEPTGSKCLTIGPCGDSRPLELAAAIIEQLRSEKSGHRVASVYGTVYRIPESMPSTLTEYYPEPGLTVHLQSGGKSVATKTDEHGVYHFAQVPPGTYGIAADLPPELLLVGSLILRRPPPSFELLRGECFDYDLYAVPRGSSKR